VKAKTSR